VGWHCPKSPLELSSHACGDPSSPGGGGGGVPTHPRAHQSQACVGLRPLQDPPRTPDVYVPVYTGTTTAGKRTIAPWDLPPGQREPRRARPAQ
ncbi:hypothetical protein M9458_050839, partial [Cirrhinus mrigala]